MFQKWLWKTHHETEAFVYQEHRWKGTRRAVPKSGAKRQPAHRRWLDGGEFEFKRPKKVTQ